MPAFTTEVLVTDHANRPIADARVTAGEATAYTDAKGLATLEWAGRDDTIRIEARGLQAQERTLDPP